MLPRQPTGREEQQAAPPARPGAVIRTAAGFARRLKTFSVGLRRPMQLYSTGNYPDASHDDGKAVGGTL
jgi:hypothetical protein